MIAGFETRRFDNDGIEIVYEIGGYGPPILLLHGFPQTRALWTHIAPKLARKYTVICPDLRGYGQSAKPEGTAAYTFRAMAQDQWALMQNLGFSCAMVIGHDRGGRVAHRLCLDRPDAVERVALLDIVPTRALLRNLTRETAKAYFHWFFLAQPAPLVEQMIEADPDAFYETLLGGWGQEGLDAFDPVQLAAYRAAWCNPDTIRAMCEDYRAGIELDFANDAADLGRGLPHKALILYGASGIMARHYDMAEMWDGQFADLAVRSIDGGHFFIDTAPDVTLAMLSEFLE